MHPFIDHNLVQHNDDRWRNARHFSSAILDVENLLVPTVTLTEVFKAMVRRTNEGMAMQAVAQMKVGKIVHLDSELAVKWFARKARSYKPV